MNQENITIPLDIQGIMVNGVTVTPEGEVHIHAASIIKGTICHCCGREINKIHGYDREIKLRHLSILDKPTYIIINPIRYVCDFCYEQPTTTQRLSWYNQRCSVTEAYEDHILKQLINSDIQDVSQKEKIGYDTIEDILDRRVGKKVNWDNIHNLPTIGIDDLSIRKGHGNFATIVTGYDDAGNKKIIGVLENREKTTVKDFFLSIPKRLRDTVKNVCTDLYEGYTEAAREVFGDKVLVTADRFHVEKLHRKVVDDVRKKEMRRLKEELPKEEYDAFKGVMWLIRKDYNELTAEEKERLDRLFKHAPTLAAVYIFSTVLSDIFDKPYTKQEAEGIIKAWMNIVKEEELRQFDKFLRTLEEKMDLITNYFVCRKNSGFVEGLNHKIRVIFGRCYGMLNKIHIFQRINLDLSGYDLGGLGKYS